MKDINGKKLVKGDDVLIIENNNKVPGTVMGISKTKIKLQVQEGVLVCEHNEVQLQKITAKGMQGNRKTTSLLENIFKDTQPLGSVSSRDNTPGIGLDTMRLFGVGFEKKNTSMRITESQKKYNTYGKLYRMLKEAFETSVEDEDLQDVAEAIAKVAAYVGKKMEQ